jgi:hypothetical protein
MIVIIKSRKIKWAGHVSSRDEKCNNLFGKSRGNKQFGRPVSEWENNIETFLIETKREGTNLILSAVWKSLANTGKNLGSPQTTGYYSTL